MMIPHFAIYEMRGEGVFDIVCIRKLKQLPIVIVLDTDHYVLINTR